MSSSRTTLANVVLPSDCYLTGHMMGGALMKMMDNAAQGRRHRGGRDGHGRPTFSRKVINIHQLLVPHLLTTLID